ncbi:pyroglutamyl-peptidase I [Paenibacillus sp. Marseille-Q4541]|uniref:pyroglutamyl-peptidase I n=1 Tax=Paenibacillus sp. Marseille-Q4541 TaxID=2831522 RepID=UPI001BACFAD0|nr:pyroglutamyl-peptidase I [Paenibacillus sp. Marseille-Q4541]
MSKKVLLTGFDPFGGESMNPSLEAVKQLNGRIAEGIFMVSYEIPTVFHESISVLTKVIQKEEPDIVICVGQAGGRAQLTPELVAINLNDARIPDNQNQQPVDEPIDVNGPAAYFSNLPVKSMVQECIAAGIPAAVSHSAGTFVCNHLFYGLMHYIHTEASHLRGGFIHIPYLPQQVLHKTAPSLGLDTITQGLLVAAVASANDTPERKIIGGSLH